MDKQEQSTEQQVWQRVRGARNQASGSDLRQLQREAMELAAVYRSLASRMAGKNQARIKRLQAGETANAEALAGMGILLRQDGERLKLWQPGTEDPKRLLERCYHRTRRSVTEYLARSADGEVGIVFERMAKRAAEHCALIAEVLGGIS